MIRNGLSILPTSWFWIVQKPTDSGNRFLLHERIQQCRAYPSDKMENVRLLCHFLLFIHDWGSYGLPSNGTIAIRIAKTGIFKQRQAGMPSIAPSLTEPDFRDWVLYKSTLHLDTPTPVTLQKSLSLWSKGIYRSSPDSNWKTFSRWKALELELKLMLLLDFCLQMLLNGLVTMISVFVLSPWSVSVPIADVSRKSKNWPDLVAEKFSVSSIFQFIWCTYIDLCVCSVSSDCRKGEQMAWLEQSSPIQCVVKDIWAIHLLYCNACT